MGQLCLNDERQYHSFVLSLTRLRGGIYLILFTLHLFCKYNVMKIASRSAFINESINNIQGVNCVTN